MYRMIWVKPEHTKFQRILWRFSQNDPIDIYELRTVVFGMAPSPFIAIRCLLEIANYIESENPKLASIIRRDFYYDDLLTGSDSIDDLINIQKNISKKLAEYGFKLRKWASNCPNVLKHIDSVIEENTLLKLNNDNSVKTLGIYWEPANDTMRYKIDVSYTKRFTKRHILSQISKIFDPLGMLGPIITTAKLIMQELWTQKINWDDEVPLNTKAKWINFITDLNLRAFYSEIDCGRKKLQN